LIGGDDKMLLEACNGVDGNLSGDEDSWLHARAYRTSTEGCPAERPRRPLATDLLTVSTELGRLLRNAFFS
jgi:hypothetical protein